MFQLEKSLFGSSHIIELEEWEKMGFVDPIDGEPAPNRVTVETSTGQVYTLYESGSVTDAARTVALEARIGPGQMTHFWYGKTLSGANIKVFPSKTTA